ncbi:MAG: aspartate aminotransferase family protein [Acetobacteraceae bacterium]|nr:aspartate aminotransferase family protein [Acetobacteraceae bacterium]
MAVRAQTELEMRRRRQEELLAKARRHLSPVLPRATELMVERGEGPFLYTLDGEKYFDFVSGIAVNSLGHCHPEVVKAIQEQAARLIHICFVTAYYEPAVELAAKLAEICPGDLDMVFFANSGAEAVEGSVKMARYVTDRPAIIAFRGGFHGRTIGATSLTSSSVRYRQNYEPLLPSVYHVPFPYCYRCPYKGRPEDCSLDCLGEIETLFKHQVAPSDVAAMLIEPVQGEGGYIPAPVRYMKGLRELCTRHGILLIFDEIQTGFGRTGRMFAAEHYGVVPDVLLLAKALASGLPLSAIVARPELHQAWPQGAHGSTYGANPVSCATALASIRVIERERLVEKAAETGDYLRKRFLEFKDRYAFIGDVRGLGLMVGMEFVDEDGGPNGDFVKKLIARSLEEKLIFYSCGVFKQCIRFMLPLNVRREDLDEGLERFGRVLARMAREA